MNPYLLSQLLILSSILGSNFSKTGRHPIKDPVFERLSKTELKMKLKFIFNFVSSPLMQTSFRGERGLRPPGAGIRNSGPDLKRASMIVEWTKSVDHLRGKFNFG